jgi:hypothetical protein
MTLGPSDARDRPEGAPASSDDRDASIVPGLDDPVPAPRAGAAHGSQRVQPLDMSKDPDRFDPTRPAVPPGPLDMSQDPDRVDPTASLSVVGPLDPARDPDRMPRAGEGQSLTDLVGKRGAQEEERDNYTWALGLLGVLAFLALVAFLFGEVLGP